MSKPTMTSLVSANGPSLSRTSPPRTRTVVADDGLTSWLPATRRPDASLSATHWKMSGTIDSSVSGSVSVQTNIMYFIAVPLPQVDFHQGDERPDRNRTADHKDFS